MTINLQHKYTFLQLIIMLQTLHNILPYLAGRAILLTAILLSVAVRSSLTPSEINIEQYQFQVYCPIDKMSTPTNLHAILKDMGVKSNLRKARFPTARGKDDVDEYVIYVQFRKASNISQFGEFFYCSYVRGWEEEDCSNARAVCSSPGPMFYVPKNKKIDVAWVYDINPAEGVTMDSNLPFDNCYFPHDAHSSHCNIINKDPGERFCTYLDPTNLSYPTSQSSQITINLTNIPVTVHVHGLEVRPTFDGNPLSYMTKGGSVGLGFQSLIDDSYFRQFSSHQPTDFRIETDLNMYAKINRYDNFQPPGSLWYHDHSMHATWPNVKNGMAGSYAIYDLVVEKHLPSRKFDVVILATTSYADPNPNVFSNESIRTVKQRPNKNHKPSHQLSRNRQDAKFVTKTSLFFQRNQTYRIRIQNGHFESIFEDVMFVTECHFSNSSNLNFSECNKKLAFSVIGADGSLFHSPIHNIKVLDIYSAERYDILIVFDGTVGGQVINPIAADQSKVYLVTGGNSLLNTILRKQFTLKSKASARHNKALFPHQVVSLNVSFYDLRAINKNCEPGCESSPLKSTTCISARRFKPFMRDSLFNLFINGHYRFGEGASDQPRIGTTEDWYFINTLLNPDLPHSIHVHLINFQVISQGEMKKMPLSSPPSRSLCSYYEIDYYIAAGALPAVNQTYQQLCNTIRGFNYSDPSLKKIMNAAFREDKPTKGTDYGFDLLAMLTPQEIVQGRYFYSECPGSPYKYICNSSIPVAAEDQRWKDVAKLPANYFVHLRIRWTSTEYDPAVKPYPFFNAPEDQLIEFPGYVYHCHFLNHEDNEMMRPFTMKPSFFFDKYYAPPQGSPLAQCMKKKGLKNADGWPARYECMNEIMGCRKA